MDQVCNQYALSLKDMANSNSEIRLSFNNNDPHSRNFASTLNKRVNEYFSSNKKTKFGDIRVYIKTVCMFLIYFVPFFVIIFAQPSIGLAIPLLVLMGTGMAGIGLGIMHDAIHGSFSAYPWVNKIFGYTLNMVGGTAVIWKIQHNVKHHTHTNVEGHDDDIEPRGMLRLSPSVPLKSYHKFQYIYAWFMYALGTFFWVTVKEFGQMEQYRKEGLLKQHSKSVVGEYIILLISKVFYYAYIIGLPVLLTDYTGWQIFAGFAIMHLVSGTCLAVIFQPAHLMLNVSFPKPDENGKLQYSWLVHQLYTTVNYAKNNKLVTWYGSGLNFQIEHHLFPHICHIHYPAISKIVEKTAKEFDMPYMTVKSFRSSLSAHTTMLKNLGAA